MRGLSYIFQRTGRKYVSVCASKNLTLCDGGGRIGDRENRQGVWSMGTATSKILQITLQDQGRATAVMDTNGAGKYDQRRAFVDH